MSGVLFAAADAGHSHGGAPVSSGTVLLSIVALALLAGILWLGAWLVLSALRDRRSGLE